MKIQNKLIEELQADTTNQAEKFYSYYRQLYDSLEIQSKVAEVRYVRNKVLVHNDYKNQTKDIKIELVKYLSNFAHEMGKVFNTLFVHNVYGERIGDLKATYLNKVLKKFGVEK